LASIAGWAVHVWTWFKGDGSDGAALAMAATMVLTVIKIAQEVRAWHARDEERQALRKLWERMSRRTRPGRLDSRIDP
jgi:hypothetical protein